jgi:hypothetical protein
MEPQSNNTASQMDVRIPKNFANGKNYIPIAQLNSINGQNLPAIGNYSSQAPDIGTWVLGAINGEIQWIETQDC